MNELIRDGEMPTKLTVNLPIDMPISRRITETSRQIAEWLHSVQVLEQTPGRLQLTKSEKTEKEFRYHYIIVEREELSASDVNARSKME